MSDEQVNPYDVLTVGQEIQVLIKRFTPQEHRIGLSIKELKPETKKTSKAKKDEDVELEEVTG